MFSDILNSVAKKNTAKEWLVALAIVVGCALVARLFYLLSTKVFKRVLQKAKGRLGYIILDMLEEPAAMLLVISGFYYAQRRLYFPEQIDLVVGRIISFIVILTVTWAISRLFDDIISEFLVPIVARSDSKLDDQFLPIARKASNLLIWVLGIIVAIDNAGYNVGTIIAGLGIGGLAFAFAAQETIANLFGGITVFVDAPFRIGDRIKISGFEGWVREVGIRTAKLETLDGRRLSIPNSFFSSNVIENVSSEPATRIIETLGIACNQNAGTLSRSIELTSAILKSDPDLTEKSAVYFKDFGDSSYNLELILWFRKDCNIMEARTRINMAVVSVFEKEKVELSLPIRYLIQGK